MVRMENSSIRARPPSVVSISRESPTIPTIATSPDPDPELPTPFGGLNRAQKISQYDLYTNWGQKTKQHQYSQDGIYYDSIGGSWVGSHLQNFRRDHMPTVDVPLTFDHKTGRVTITHGFSTIKYLRYSTMQAHQEGRPTMGNTWAGDFLPFVAPWLDMGGAGENYQYQADFSDLKEIRAMMGAKPLSYLNNADFDDPAKAEAAMDRLLLYAAYPGAAQYDDDGCPTASVSSLHSNLQRPRRRRLGGDPLCSRHHGRCRGAKPWCERFGHGLGGYFFAIRNPGEAAELTLTLSASELRALRLESTKFVAVTACQIKSVAVDHVVLAVPAQWTAVVAVNRDDANKLAENSRKEVEEWRGAK